MKAGDIFSADADELWNSFQKFINDPETQREKRRKKDEWEEQRLDIESRPKSGPDAPTDGELLNLMSKGFEDLFGEIPFGNDYDHLIERLSFTHSEVDDERKLKTAWTTFLNEADTAFDELTLSEGVAGWYEEREMYAHAIAVYEHLYALVRQGELGHGDFDQRSDSSQRSSLETWLTRLVKLYSRQEQPERARHLGELIEDYYIDGYVSLAGYIEIISFLPELSRTAIARQACSDRDEAWNKLKYEQALLFDDLHDRTKEMVVEAELWSNKHWINISPWIAPLCWAKTIESEFHHKVFMPNRPQIQELLGDDAPRPNQVCGLGHIIKVIRNAGSNVGLKCLFAEMRGSQFLASLDTFAKLDRVRDDRNRIAHISERKTYTSKEGCNFLREVRESKWIFDFLDALQPRNPSARN